MNIRTKKILLITTVTLILFSIVTYVYVSNNLVLNHPKTDSPETPYNTKVYIDTNGCLHASWNTQEKSIGYIRYGESADEVNKSAQSKNGLIYSESHSISVCTIDPNKNYHVIVMSNNIPYGYRGQPIKTE